MQNSLQKQQTRGTNNQTAGTLGRTVGTNDQTVGTNGRTIGTNDQTAGTNGKTTGTNNQTVIFLASGLSVISYFFISNYKFIKNGDY